VSGRGRLRDAKDGDEIAHADLTALQQMKERSRSGSETARKIRFTGTVTISAYADKSTGTVLSTTASLNIAVRECRSSLVRPNVGEAAFPMLRENNVLGWVLRTRAVVGGGRPSHPGAPSAFAMV
jgi:hypothetical protein